MSYPFIQVTARKDSNNFACCSNLSFMDNQNMTPEQAEMALVKMAGEYAAKGYNVEWIREEMHEDEVEFWAPLFTQDRGSVSASRFA